MFKNKIRFLLMTMVFFGAAFFQTAQIFGQTDAPAPVAYCKPAPVGLVSWYPAENNALDIRSRNNGTLTGTQGHFPTYAAGKVGQAFQFDGQSLVSIPDSPSLHITQTLTLEAWVNPAAGQSGLPSIVFKGNGSSLAGQPYSLFLDASDPNNYKLDFRIGNETTATALNSVTSLQPNAYTFVAATYDGATMRIYINGVLDNSITNNFGTLNNTDTNPLAIGDGVGNFIGAVDEFSIYNRVLSATEIQAISLSNLNGKCKPTATVAPSGQVAWFAGDGDTNDLSGNGNNGVRGSQTAFAVGKVGQTFQFNGNSAAEIIVPDSNSLDLNTLTIEGWVNPTTIGNADAPVVLKGDLSSAGTQPYSVLYTSQAILFRVGNSSTFDTVFSGAIPLNAYTHFAATYDGTKMSLYINGTLAASKTTTIGTLLADNRQLLIGGAGSAFTGAIDELSLYNRALSAVEIQSIFNADLAGKLKQTTIATNTATVGSATVTFSNATTRTVQQIPLNPALFPALPMGTNTGLDFDIAADVPDSSPTVCFNLPTFTTAQFPNLRIYHLEGGVWVNRTATMNTYPILCTTGLTSLSPFAIGLNAPTAASASIGGRVMTTIGRGISNARVYLTDPAGNVRLAMTNPFGYYRFDDVSAGETYVLTVSAKRYRFENPTRVLSVNEDLSEIDFTALP